MVIYKKLNRICIAIMCMIIICVFVTGCSDDKNGGKESSDKLSYELEQLTDDILIADDYIQLAEALSAKTEDKEIYHAVPYKKGVLYTRYFHYSETSDFGWELCYVDEETHQIVDSGVATKKALLPSIAMAGDSPVYVHEMNENEQEPSYVIKRIVDYDVNLIAERKGEALVGDDVEAFGEWYAFTMRRNSELLICVGNFNQVERCISLGSDMLFAFDLTETHLLYVTEGEEITLYAVNLSDGEKTSVILPAKLNEICGGKDSAAVGQSGDTLYFIDVAENQLSVEELVEVPMECKNITLTEEIVDGSIVIQSEKGDYKFLVNNMD